MDEMAVGGKRFEDLGKPGLACVVALFERHPRRPHAGQDVVQLAAQQLAAVRLQHGSFGAYGVDEFGQCGVAELDLGKSVAKSGHDVSETLLRGKVIAAVVQQRDAGVGPLRHRGQQLPDLVHGAPERNLTLRVGVPDLFEPEPGRVAVTAALVDGQNRTAVGRLPVVLPAEIVDFVPVAAGVDEAVDPGLAQQLRDLGDVSERIGHVADLLDAAQPFRDLVPDQDVARVGLGRNKELVRQHVPRPQRQPPGASVRADPLGVLRVEFEMVLEEDGLAVEQEMMELGVFVELVQRAADDRRHVEPKAVERLVPLAVPVRVRHEEGLLETHRQASIRRPTVVVANATDVSAAP